MATCLGKKNFRDGSSVKGGATEIGMGDQSTHVHLAL